MLTWTAQGVRRKSTPVCTIKGRRSVRPERQQNTEELSNTEQPPPINQRRRRYLLLFPEVRGKGPPDLEVFTALNDHPRYRGGFVPSGKSKTILGIYWMLCHFRGVDKRGNRSIQGWRFRSDSPGLFHSHRKPRKADVLNSNFRLAGTRGLRHGLYRRPRRLCGRDHPESEGRSPAGYGRAIGRKGKQMEQCIIRSR
jgi:hypothetical protein